MQYEISGSVLAGQITTTTWAVAPSRTWAWSRAIGGAGRGIGGAGQFASWTRAAQLRTSTWAEAAVARATVPPRRSTLRWSCPGRALGEGSGRSGLGAPWTRAAQLATSAWAVGSVEDLGMNASTLERIRFAAANRLCVDVGYEGDVQRVEPYSLRKARGGNVVLYACEAGSSECATYRTGGISEVEVTRQTFVPKYANELLSPGR